jgi:hypothetical protein
VSALGQKPTFRNASALSALTALTESGDFRGPTKCSPALGRYEDSVVGSIILFTAVIFVAGNPLIVACSRIIASSLAR